MNKIIPIFFATDNNYMPFLKVAVQSITENASKDYTYNIHVLYHTLSDDSKAMLNEYNTQNFNIIYNNVEDSLAKLNNHLFVRDYYSKATYYRIFIPSMFPEYKKALYLDCDIVVNKDISLLFNTELGNNLLAGVPDEAVAGIPEFYSYTRDFLGVHESNYFNAGILVMNLETLREFNFEDKFVDLVSKYQFKVAQDQDYLNVLCKDRVVYLPKIWNKMPIEDKDTTENDICLIHYNLSFKPWHYDGILYESWFWKYTQNAGLTEAINQIKADFTYEDQLNDKTCGEALIKLAGLKSEDENSFKLLVERGVINIEALGSK